MNRASVQLYGRRGSWSSRPSLSPAVAVRPPSGPPTKTGGRQDDGLPKPQAFAISVIQAYPARTAACRQCDELVLPSCGRGWCAKLGNSHATIINAIADGACPIDRFTEEL